MEDGGPHVLVQAGPRGVAGHHLDDGAADTPHVDLRVVRTVIARSDDLGRHPVRCAHHCCAAVRFAQHVVDGLRGSEVCQRAVAVVDKNVRTLDICVVVGVVFIFLCCYQKLINPEKNAQKR